MDEDDKVYVCEFCQTIIPGKPTGGGALILCTKCRHIPPPSALPSVKRPSPFFDVPLLVPSIVVAWVGLAGIALLLAGVGSEGDSALVRVAYVVAGLLALGTAAIIYLLRRIALALDKRA